MDIRMIALDLDGTLTDDNKKISPYTVEILHQASGKGAKIVLASGRPLLGILPVAKEIGLFEMGGMIVAFNGGHIFDCKSGEDIYRAVFPKEYIREVCDFAKANHVSIISYDSEQIITEGPVDEWVGHEVYNTGAKAKIVPDLPGYINEIGYPIVKMLICADPQALVSIEKELAQKYDGKLDIYRAEPYFLEVMPKGINKAAGLRMLMEKTGITREQLMACGDANNDLPMLSEAALSVAVGNASDDVKKHAAFVSKSNNEDGVAYAVKKFVLDGEELEL